MLRGNKIPLVLAAVFLVPVPGRADDDTAFDQDLAAKYDLQVPPAATQLEPAPDWIRQAEIVSSSAAVWRGYKFLLEETPVTRIVRAREGHRKMQVINYDPVEKVSGVDAEAVRGIPLLSHVPHSADASHSEVEFLNRVHLGRGLAACQEAEQVAHRFFENGLVVLNDSQEDREMTLRVPDELAHTQLLDLYDGRTIVSPDEGVVKVRVPSQAARILAARDKK